MEYATLIAEVRTRMSNPSESMLPNDTIRYAIDSALGELSRLQPYYVYHDLDMVKDVEEYDIDPDIISIRNFWYTPHRHTPIHREWMNLTGSAGVPVDSDHNEYAGLKVFHSPSLLSILDEKWDRIRARQLMSWEFNPDTNKLLVIPTPKEAGKSVYKGVIMRDIDTIGRKHEAAFKDLVVAMSMESWIFKVSSIKSIPVGVGKVDYDTDNLRRISTGMKQEALKKLMSGGSGVVIG